MSITNTCNTNVAQASYAQIHNEATMIEQIHNEATIIEQIHNEAAIIGTDP